MLKNIINFIKLNTYMIKEYVISKYFLSCGYKRQDFLIMKNASMFIALQNLAKKHSDNGDLVSSMDISGESYKYLCRFALYCDLKKLNQIDVLNMYS